LVFDGHWRGVDVLYQENLVIDTLTERSLQFVALVLGGRTARSMLIDFYVKRGVEDSETEGKVAGQAKKVRMVVIPVGLAFLVVGMYARSVLQDAGFQLSTSIAIYFGIFVLACQLPRGKRSSASWDSLKTLLKK
jgi:hypothetical protein